MMPDGIVITAAVGGRIVVHREPIDSASPGWGVLPALDRAVEGFRDALDGEELPRAAREVPRLR